MVQYTQPRAAAEGVMPQAASRVRAAAADTRAAVKCLYHPQAVSYGTVMGALHGIHFQRATKLLICFNWFMLLAYFLLSLTNCYFIIADEVGSGICGWALSIIAAVSVVPAVQVRTFHYLAPMSTVGLVGMIVMVIIVLVSLAVYPVAPPADSVSDLWPSSDLTFLQLYSNVSNIIFAYQGQSMFFELMAEMR